MSNYTAAANEHRDGYQAGYADAVKAFEAARPAAAQEAVPPLGYVRLEAIKRLREDDEVTGVMVHVDAPTDSVPVYLTPVAAAPGIDPALQIVLKKLQRFAECTEDGDNDGCDIGRDWFDALTTIGLLERTQRSPALWTMTKAGEALIDASPKVGSDAQDAARWRAIAHFLMVECDEEDEAKCAIVIDGESILWDRRGADVSGSVEEAVDALVRGMPVSSVEVGS